MAFNIYNCSVNLYLKFKNVKLIHNQAKIILTYQQLSLLNNNFI